MPRREAIYLIRFVDVRGRVQTRVEFSHADAGRFLLARQREHRDNPRSGNIQHPRMFRIGISSIESDEAFPQEWRDDLDDRYGPVIWRHENGQMTGYVDEQEYAAPDAERVEFVEDGSPGGPAADLLDPAEVRTDSVPADSP